MELKLCPNCKKNTVSYNSYFNAYTCNSCDYFQPLRDNTYWVWYEDWTPSTTDSPAECQDAGWYCSNCKWSPNQELSIEFDTPEDKPKFKYCPNCGLFVKDEIEISQNQEEKFLYLNIE